MRPNFAIVVGQNERTPLATAEKRQARVLVHRKGWEHLDLQVHTELQGDLLVATATGTAAFEPALKILKGICDMAAEKHIHKILVNALAVNGVFSTTERFQLGVQVTAHIQQRKFNPRLAFVGLPPTSDGFAVRVGQNRDLSVELFPNVEAALRWLASWPSAS
jgi:hypothetical protein